jgi:hypothetical protein
MQALALVMQRTKHGRNLLNVTSKLCGCFHQLLICRQNKQYNSSF